MNSSEFLRCIQQPSNRITELDLQIELVQFGLNGPTWDSHSIPQAPVIWEWVVANYTLQTRLVLFTSHCLGMAMHTHLNTHIWLLCVCVCVFQSVDANLVFLRVCVFVYVCNYVRLQSFWLMLACVCVCFACVCFVSSRSGAHASTSV